MDLNPKDTVPPEKRANHIICKRCGARVDPTTGKCTDKACGLIQRPEIPPTDKISQSKTTRFSPTGQQSAKHQKSIDVLSLTPQYVCPNCGTNVSAAQGQCPNQRGCGYSGYMKPKTGQQPILNVEPEDISTASTSISPTAKSFLSEKEQTSATIEHYTPTTRSPILDEIDHVEIEGRGFPKRAKREKQVKPKRYSEGREWHFPSMERFRKPALASLKLLGIVAVIVLVVFVVGKYITPAASQFISQINLPPPPSQTQTPTSPKSYSLSIRISPQEGGNITRFPEPEKESYEPGTQVTLTAIPASGYAFDHWEGDVSDRSSTMTIRMDLDKNITAYFIDKVAPIISEVQVTDIIDTSASVIWATSENTIGYVEYGETENYQKVVQSTSGRAANHIARLTNLTPSTMYHFRVRSKDLSDNDAPLYTSTFTTLRAIPAGYEIGKRAPDFTMTSYRDNSDPNSPNNPISSDWKEFLSLSDFRGKTVIVNCWSTYCGACLLEFPVIRDVYQQAELANRNKNPNLALLTVCIEDREDRIVKIENKFSNQVGHFTFPILLDKEGIIKDKDKYNIRTVPTTLFIDPEGIIRYTKVGAFETTDEVKNILKSFQQTR